MSELTGRLPPPRAYGRALALSFCVALLAQGCSGDRVDVRNDEIRLGGRTMGTGYSAILLGSADASRVEAVIDSVLVAINAEVNTYDPRSLITRVNGGEAVELPLVVDPLARQSAPGAHLSANLALALRPYTLSGGLFDPTVGPLVEYYGFGARGADTAAVDPAEVARLLGSVGFEKVRLDTQGRAVTVSQGAPGVALDLSAIAKGYAVDQLLLGLAEEFGFADMFVEVGGEVRAVGMSARGTPWVVAVNTPAQGASLRDVELALELRDAALATSGNYRNERLKGGERLVHTIDPRTGAATPSRLLSASVRAPDCATADAFATACMAAGDSAAAVLQGAGLDGCLIFAGAGTRYAVTYVGDF